LAKKKKKLSSFRWLPIAVARARMAAAAAALEEMEVFRNERTNGFVAMIMANDPKCTALR
jgi:hypothetical protein